MIFQETLTLHARPSLQQLWHALWERVENPALFLGALQSFVILEKKPDAIYRRLHFPQTIVRDIVRWQPYQWISFDVIPNGAHISGNLTLKIQGDAQNGFAITFIYETTDYSDEDKHLAKYVQSAYHHANLDQMARLEKLCNLLN